MKKVNIVKLQMNLVESFFYSKSVKPSFGTADNNLTIICIKLLKIRDRFEKNFVRGKTIRIIFEVFYEFDKCVLRYESFILFIKINKV